MNLFENITSSIKNVFNNKMRAFLTMLGIIIGVASVIAITSIGEGSSKQIEEQFSSMGIGNLTVQVTGGREVRNADQLTMDDVALIQSLEGIKYISPVYNGSNATVKLLNPKETKTATVTGVNQDYQHIQSETILYGRFITENDVDMASKVVVIDNITAEAVFGAANETVIGEKISVKTWRSTSKYTVIGITESSSTMASMYSDDYPATVYMPITTCMRFFLGSYLSTITLTGEDPETLDILAEEITAALETAHNNSDKYYVQNIMSIMEQVTSVSSTVTLLISFIAGISLLVGGIGVMNIMLVTVTERTREIGIRKSIGAKNSHIRIQFIIEAITLTALGGLLGIGFGILGGTFIGQLMSITAVVSPSSIAVAVSISSGIGLIFGVYPANKAAKLNPIEALRYE